VLSYRDALARLFILDPVGGWVPTNNPLKRLTQSDKHHLADPALAVSLLGRACGICAPPAASGRST
jgi:hypothetical protein